MNNNIIKNCIQFIFLAFFFITLQSCSRTSHVGCPGKDMPSYRPKFSKVEKINKSDSNYIVLSNSATKNI